VRDELLKLFRPPHAARGLRLLHESGLLAHVLPELAATIGCQQSPDYHPEGDVFTHIGLMLEQLPADAPPELAWAVLLHDIAKPQTASRNEQTGSIHFYGHEKVGADMSDAILRRLRFPNQQIEVICDAVRHHMQFKDVPKMRKATLRRMLLRDTFPLELALHRLDCLGSHRRLDHYDFLVRNAEELAHQPELIPPLLNGRDVLAAGVPAGPQVGALLTELRDLQLDGALTSAEAAREWLRERAQKLAVEGPSA
jgi:poly(A) polymerase